MAEGISFQKSYLWKVKLWQYIYWWKWNCKNRYSSLLRWKTATEPLEEEFSGEQDIYSLGVILFELLTENTNFKLEKCKNEIHDEDLLHIIDKCTNKKSTTYEDLNKFIENADAYLEYGGKSTVIDT